MDLDIFNKSIKNREINITPYVIVLSIFISILVIVIIFNNSVRNYLVLKGNVVDKRVVVTVNNDELNKVVENNKIIIERNNHIFTYKVFKINNLNDSNYLYSEVILETEIPEEYLIENNIIKVKIVTRKTTIFDYLIKTMKGEQ